MAEEMEKITEKIQEMQLEDESKTELYRERIKGFPNIMEESFDKTKEVWSSLYKKVEDSLNNDILFGLEDEIRQKNVKVFILWQLKEEIRAEELANEVREKKPDNLVALTNLAFIHLYNGNISKIEKLLDNLSSLAKREDFPQIEAEGKRNVAYCVATVSFNDYERAIKLYKEAVDVCPNNYLCLFSIALLQYRCLRNIKDKEKQHKYIKESIQCLEIIESDFPHHIDKALMGRTLTLMGLFKYSPFNHRSKFCEEYFQRALHHSPNDHYVLQKSAQFYLRSYKLEQAEKFFEKAIEIKETSFSHHQLGLLYLRKNNPKHTYFPVNENLSKQANDRGKILKYATNIPHMERNEFINKAEYHYKEALKLSPEISPVLYDMILLYMSLKEYGNARKYCEIFKTDIGTQNVSFNILFGRLYFILANEENDEEEKDQLRRFGMDRFVLALKSAKEFLPFDKDLIEIWEIKKIMLDLYKYGNENTEYKRFLLELFHSVKDLANDKELQNILHMESDKSEL